MRRYVVQHWVAGWNLRGFLPDTEHVLHGASAEHAVDYIAGELAQLANSTEGWDLSVQYSKAWETTQDWNIGELERIASTSGGRNLCYWEVVVGNYVYWVRPCFTVNCNQVKEN